MMVKINPLRFGVILLLLVLWPLGCSSVKPRAPEVSLSRLQVGEMNLSHANLLAVFRVYNPNLIALTLEQVDYSLTLNGIEVSSGSSVEPLTVAGQGYGELSVKLSAAYLDLLRTLNLAKKDKAINYSLRGNILVGGLGLVRVNFPLQQNGIIKLEK
jgi:LEA14-like dessication related protein